MPIINRIIGGVILKVALWKLKTGNYLSNVTTTNITEPNNVYGSTATSGRWNYNGGNLWIQRTWTNGIKIKTLAFGVARTGQSSNPCSVELRRASDNVWVGVYGGSNGATFDVADQTTLYNGMRVNLEGRGDLISYIYVYSVSSWWEK